MKKLIALILIIPMLLSSFTTAFAADDESLLTKEFVLYNELEFLETLGITNPGIDTNIPLTRALFTDMAVRAMNYPIPEESDGVFSDVTADTPYSGSIKMAKNIGLVTGIGNDGFRPDEVISYGAAVKIAVTALGYKRIAMAKGDYPTGYISVANSLDLLDGVVNEADGTLSFEGAVQLIFNMLRTDMCKDTGIVDVDVVQSQMNGVTILTDRFKFTLVEGVVKSTPNASMIYGHNPEKSELYIDGSEYKTNIKDTAKYIGLSVEAYVNDKKEVKLIYPTSDNNVISLTPDEIGSYNNFTLTTYSLDGIKSKNYNISKDFAFILNGESIIPTKTDFEIKLGEMTLIDNNSDGRYEVILAKKANYMIVSSVSLSNEAIYDGHKSNNTLELSSSSDVSYIIKDISDSGTQTTIDIEDIKADDVLKVYKSASGKMVEAYRYSKKLNGTIDEMNEDKLFIAGEEYQLNNYMSDTDKAKLKLGTKYNFYLACDGTVTYVTEGGTSLAYGYLVNFGKIGSGLSQDVMVRILTTSDDIIEAKLKDKIKLNGTSYDADSITVHNQFKDDINNKPKYQILKYQLSDDGMITALETYSDFDIEATRDDKYQDNSLGGDGFKRYAKAQNSFWYPTYTVFGPYATISENTAIFSVPSNISNAGDTATYDDDLFTAKSIKNLWTTYKGNIIIDTYNVDGSMTAEAIVIYDPNAAATAGTDVSPNAGSSIVEKVNEAANSEGESTYSITVWNDNRFTKYLVEPEYAKILKADANKLPTSGDVVRLSANNKNEIIGLEIDIDYNSSDGSISIKGTSDVNNLLNEMGKMLIGKSYIHSTSSMSLDMSKTGGFAASSGYYDAAVDDLVPLTIPSNVKISVYDKKLGEVRHGSIDDIEDISSVGETNASNIVVRAANFAARTIFIYK